MRFSLPFAQNLISHIIPLPLPLPRHYLQIMAFRSHLTPSSHPVHQTLPTVVENVSQTMPMTSGHQRVLASAKMAPSRDMARLEDPGGVMGTGEMGLQVVPVTTR
jgi:hypothetical protein